MGSRRIRLDRTAEGGQSLRQRNMNSEPQFRLAAEADAGTLLRFMREYYVFDGHGFEEHRAHVALIGLLLVPFAGPLGQGSNAVAEQQ